MGLSFEELERGRRQPFKMFILENEEYLKYSFFCTTTKETQMVSYTVEKKLKDSWGGMFANFCLPSLLPLVSLHTETKATPWLPPAGAPEAVVGTLPRGL